MRQRRLLAALGLVALTLSGCGGQGTSGITGNGQQPKSGEVAVLNCQGDRNVRPVTVVLNCSDGNAIVEHAQWSSWTVTAAEGTGVLSVNDCQPSCTNGHFHNHDVDLVAKVPLGTPSKRNFTVLVTTTSGGGSSAIPTVYQLTEAP